MGLWKKKYANVANSDLNNAVLRGAPHEVLTQHALASLVAGETGDRFGVWLEAGAEPGVPESSFHGLVWDREDENPPREWKSLAPQRVLSLSKLVGANITTMSSATSSEPVVGPTAGLAKVLWVPIEHAAKLRGVLLAGAFSAKSDVSIERAKAVASELALALAFESERRFAQERHADLALCNRVLTSLSDRVGAEGLLRDLVESCLQSPGFPENPGAACAALASLPEDSAKAGLERLRLTITCIGGGETEQQLLRSEGVRELSRQSVESRRTAGGDIGGAGAGELLLRIVAIPLASRTQESKVLLVGFRPGALTLSTLERLELRGRLLSQVLTAEWDRHERRLHEAKESALLEANANAIVLLGKAGEIRSANRNARILLSSEAKLFPATDLEIHRSSAPAKLLSEFVSAHDRKKVAAWENAGDSVRRPGSPDVSMLELENGAKVKMTWEDLENGQKAVTLLPAEAVLAERDFTARAQLLSLTEWLDVGVVIYDSEENIRLTNLRFAQIAGLSAVEAENLRSLDQLVRTMSLEMADPEAAARHWKKAVSGAESGGREELYLVRPVARVLERVSRPVFDEQGARIGRIELYKDLTAQRVFHAKLLQTERLAALGQMISGVAHELSNPLTSILGYAQRLLVSSDGESHFEEVRRIFAEAERAGNILRRMLLAARETTAERRPVNLNQLIQQTIELQRFSLAAERIRVELALDATLPDVWGDAGQLQQVLINLTGNARQAIESQGSGGTIRVRTEGTLEGRVRLQVSDSGAGIPQAIQARIFDPFFTTKPAGIGTGLGLSIVLSLVREHGGQVHVESPRGGGAIFTVELPTMQEQGKAPAREQEAAAAPLVAEFTQPKTGSSAKVASAHRVLIVEDEPTVAQLIADLLRDEGFEAEILLEGRDATERIVRGNFDLIVCDMKMPNLDGQSLYESLAGADSRLQSRFLFVTGDVMGSKTQSFLARNRIPYVAKPFRVEELLEKVHQVLQPAATTASVRVSSIRKNSATTG